jgi:hypothetical protein
VSSVTGRGGQRDSGHGYGCVSHLSSLLMRCPLGSRSAPLPPRQDGLRPAPRRRRRVAELHHDHARRPFVRLPPRYRRTRAPRRRHDPPALSVATRAAVAGAAVWGGRVQRGVAGGYLRMRPSWPRYSVLAQAGVFDAHSGVRAKLTRRTESGERDR